MTALLWIIHSAFALTTFALVIEQDRRYGKRIGLGWALGYFAASFIFWPALLFLWIAEHLEHRSGNGGGE